MSIVLDQPMVSWSIFDALRNVGLVLELNSAQYAVFLGNKYA